GVILPSRRSVREWLEAFAACVRARDFAGGRILFAEDAMGFGTVATVAESRAVLIREQWRRVWTRTAGFRFERKGSRVEVSPDGLMAVAMVRWRASNNPASPRRLDRRGRATVVLRRARVDGAVYALLVRSASRSRSTIARKILKNAVSLKSASWPRRGKRGGRVGRSGGGLL